MFGQDLKKSHKADLKDEKSYTLSIYLFRTHQFSHLAIDNFFSQSSLAMWYVGMYHFLRHRKIVLTEVIII